MKESQLFSHLVCATNVPSFSFRIIEGRMHFHGYHCMKRSDEVRAARRVELITHRTHTHVRATVALRGSLVSRREEHVKIDCLHGPIRGNENVTRRDTRRMKDQPIA